MAADARRDLARLHAVLPHDCAGVVLDVCGLLKGLQEVERDRGWPRRSAKLVLRIGLEQLAQHYGLGAAARGAETRRKRSWLGEGAGRPNSVESQATVSARASDRIRLTIATRPLERCVDKCSRKPSSSKIAMASVAAISSGVRPE